MKWKMVKKGNKWKKRPTFDIDEYETLLIILLVVSIAVIQIIIRGA